MIISWLLGLIGKILEVIVKLVFIAILVCLFILCLWVITKCFGG